MGRSARKRPFSSTNSSKSESTSLPPTKKQRLNTSSRINDYIAHAKECIHLKFIYKASQLNDNDGFFKPVYTHQIFEKEKINGYKNLSIKIYFSQPHLYTFLDITYDDKLPDAEDLEETFKKWLKAGFVTSKNEFVKVC